MKKILLISTTVFCCFAARSQAFEMGRSYVSVGYGVGNFATAFVKAAATGSNIKTSFFGPMFLKYEYAISEKVGFGVAIAYLSAKATSDDSYYDQDNVQHNYTITMDFSTWSALARVNYHLSDNEKFDPYIGMGMGYRNGGLKFTYSDNNAPKVANTPTLFPFGMEMTMGARYMLAPNIGLYGEVGFAKAVIQGGIVIKL